MSCVQDAASRADLYLDFQPQVKGAAVKVGSCWSLPSPSDLKCALHTCLLLSTTTSFIFTIQQSDVCIPIFNLMQNKICSINPITRLYKAQGYHLSTICLNLSYIKNIKLFIDWNELFPPKSVLNDLLWILRIIARRRQFVDSCAAKRLATSSQPEH